FVVNIGEKESVSELKKVIKTKKAAKTKDVDDPDNLQIFLAKTELPCFASTTPPSVTEGGQWLSSKDPDVDLLLSGAIPERVKKTYLNKQLNAGVEIDHVFGGASPSKTIHVLMKIPK
ncbi:hypothetical protein PHYSODRAFT_379373, partial [Phytophthora sojae]